MGSVFRFWTASDLVVLTGERAETVGALREMIERASGACLFHHTFQVLRERHFVTDQFPNDFAEWVREGVRDEVLGEALAGLDIRTVTSIEGLRAWLLATFDEHLDARPRLAAREAREPFDLCRSQTATMPTDQVADGPADFAAAIRRVGIRSVYFHLVTARLRLQLATNDFSVQLREWGLPAAADRVEALDIYGKTLYELRAEVARIVESEVGS